LLERSRFRVIGRLPNPKRWSLAAKLLRMGLITAGFSWVAPGPAEPRHQALPWGMQMRLDGRVRSETGLYIRDPV
jgi:hypothetical protein